MTNIEIPLTFSLRNTHDIPSCSNSKRNKHYRFTVNWQASIYFPMLHQSGAPFASVRSFSTQNTPALQAERTWCSLWEEALQGERFHCMPSICCTIDRRQLSGLKTVFLRRKVSRKLPLTVKLSYLVVVQIKSNFLFLEPILDVAVLKSIHEEAEKKVC